jgi:threonine dehydratase
MNRLLTTPARARKRGIVTASRGNQGVAVARSDFSPAFRPPSTCRQTPRGPKSIALTVECDCAYHWGKMERCRTRLHSRRPSATDASISILSRIRGWWPATGPSRLEMLEDGPDANVYVVAIGWGGLIAGVATVVPARNPRARLFGVEPVGSPTLHAALVAGGPVRLERPWTRVATMSCGMTA